MTSPRIDRLARAAYDRLSSSDDCWVEGCEPFIDLSSVTVDGNVNLIELVRAVLMAVREPDEAMQRAFWGQCAVERDDVFGTQDFKARHAAMIDSILAEGE